MVLTFEGAVKEEGNCWTSDVEAGCVGGTVDVIQLQNNKGNNQSGSVERISRIGISTYRFTENIYCDFNMLILNIFQLNNHPQMFKKLYSYEDNVTDTKILYYEMQNMASCLLI